MSYDYIRRTYGVNPKPGNRVTTVDGKKSGVIKRRTGEQHYVYVLIDGEKHAKPYHPTDLKYT